MRTEELVRAFLTPLSKKNIGMLCEATVVLSDLGEWKTECKQVCVNVTSEVGVEQSGTRIFLAECYHFSLYV